ncbi:MAG: response regulator [Limisphaerales bacterium]
MKKVTVVIAEDHPLVRRGIRGMIESQTDIEVIGESDNGIEALRMIEDLVPDVFVVDVVMPGMTGIEVLRHTQRLIPRPRAIFLSLYDNDVYVWSALRNGASAYIMKHSAADHLVPAIRSAMEGKQYTHPPITDTAYMRVDEMGHEEQTKSDLSDQERTAMHMLADGFQDPQIGSRFKLENSATQELVSGLMQKFEAETRRDLVRTAQKRTC